MNSEKKPNKSIASQAGMLLFGVMCIALFLIILEFFTGNGDGVWMDYDIGQVAFRICAWIAFIFVLIIVARKSPPIIQNLMLFVFMIGATLWFADWAVGFMSTLKIKKQQETSTGQFFSGPAYDSSFVKDDWLGLKPIPNMKFHWLKTLNGKPAQEAWINTDSLSRRKVPIIDSLGTRTKFATFFGCSFTFGDGLNDDETMPYFFEKANPQYKTYNYSYFGYSSRHMLAHLQHSNLPKQIPQKEGIGLYVYMDDHVNRNIPSVGWIGLYNGFFPDLDESTMQTEGVYRVNHPFRYKFGMMLFNSRIRRNYGLDYPFKYRDEDYELTADIIKASADSYQQQFKNSPFYVVLYPGVPATSPIRELLKARGVKFFDYSKLIPFPSKQYMQKHDSHPNAEAQKRVIDQLSIDLASQKVI